MAEGEIGKEELVEHLEAVEIRLGGFPVPQLLEQVQAGFLELVPGEVEGPHPVGFEPKRQGQMVRGNRLVVQRLVLEGVGVERSADPVDGGDVLQRRDIGRPGRHHELFKKVGHAGLAGLLMDRSGVVADGHGDDGKIGMIMQNDGQAVFQGVMGDAAEKRRLSGRGNRQDDGQGRRRGGDPQPSQAPRYHEP